MIDAPIWVAALGLLGVAITALSLYLQARQRLAFDRETERRKIEDERRKAEQEHEEEKRVDERRAVALMVDNYESIVEEVGGFNKRNRETWDEVQKVQRANIDCERRCADLEQRVRTQEREISTLKDLITRWKNHAGQEIPP